MGDLQSFLNETVEKSPAPKRVNRRFLLIGLASLLILSGAVWMLLSWQQVRKANKEKEILAAEVKNLLAERERLEKAQVAGEVMPEGKENDSFSNDAAPAASIEPPLQVKESVEQTANKSKQVVEAAPPVQTAEVPSNVQEKSIKEQPPTSNPTELGRFLIVAGAGKTLEDAGTDVERLQRVGVDNIKIYYRGNHYRIVAGPFAKGQTNEQLETVKKEVNASAYLVRTDTWCDSPVQKEGYIECR